MAAIAIIGAGLVALYFIARGEGVDVGSTISDLGSSISNDLSSLGESVSVGLGTASDPIAVAKPIVKNFEGFSARRYPDPPGQTRTYSIGWGHQIKPGEPYDENSVIDESEGDQLLDGDLGIAFTCVQNNVSGAELSVQQQAALISFCFNLGCNAFEGSTMLSLINQGNLDAAANEFPKWVYAGGAVNDSLVSRRSQEQSLFSA